MAKRYLTLEYDQADVFDAVVKVGDQGETLGKRLLGIMLEGPRFVTDLGLGVYGITPRHSDCDPVDVARAGWQAEREAESEKIWVILQEPGKVPQRKGPFDHEWCKRFIREVLEARSTAYITVLESDGYGGFWPSWGGEWLEIADGRSAPRVRRHNATVKAAHGDHSVEPAPDVWTPRRLAHLVEISAEAMRARSKPLSTAEKEAIVERALEVEFSTTGREG